MDTFIEKLVTRKKDAKDIAIITAIVFAAVILVLIAPMIPYISGISLFVAAAVLFGAYYLIKSRNVEFEYSVTNGDLDIDRIVAQRKRKRIFSASCKEFDMVARISNPGAENEIRNVKKRVEAVSALNSPNVYYITLMYKGERTVVFFEPDDRMLESFKTFIPRKVVI